MRHLNSLQIQPLGIVGIVGSGGGLARNGKDPTSLHILSALLCTVFSKSNMCVGMQGHY